MYILGVSVMQVHHDHWIGTSFLFIGGSISAYVGFLLDSTRKGHLCSGAIVVSIGFVFIGKPLLFILSDEHQTAD